MAKVIFSAQRASLKNVKNRLPSSVFFFAQATFVHVQKVPKIFCTEKFFCTFKKGVFWHVKSFKI